jgi:hypothetical protein
MVRELWQNGGSSSAEYVDSGDPAHEYATASGVILEPDGLFIANVLSPPPALTRPEADSTAIQNLIVIASDDPAALPAIEWTRAAVGQSGRALTDRWPPVEYLQTRYFVHGVRWR